MNPYPRAVSRREQFEGLIDDLLNLFLMEIPRGVEEFQRQRLALQSIQPFGSVNGPVDIVRRF